MANNYCKSVSVTKNIIFMKENCVYFSTILLYLTVGNRKTGLPADTESQLLLARNCGYVWSVLCFVVTNNELFFVESYQLDLEQSSFTNCVRLIQRFYVNVE